MATLYVTATELKATLELSNETYADADIAVAVDAASRMIDDHCRRRFYADADALQVRYYSPFIPDLLVVDDVITITELATDPGGDGTFENTWTVNTDYLALPLNRELVDATNYEPWRTIKRHPAGRYQFPTAYPRSVKLTGKFGWPVVPSRVEQATTIMAGRLLKRGRETPYGVVGLGLDGGSVRIPKVDADVQALLARLVRGRGFS